MNEQQPKILIDANDEIMSVNHQFTNQQRVKLLLQNWQQKAEIEDLKKTITELAKSLKDNEE